MKLVSPTTTEQILDSLPAAVYVKDLKGRYIFVNQEAQKRLLNTRAWQKDLENKNHTFTDEDFFDDVTASRLQAADEKVIATGERVTVSYVPSASPTSKDDHDTRTTVVKSPLRDNETRETIGVCNFSISSHFDDDESCKDCSKSKEKTIQDSTQDSVDGVLQDLRYRSIFQHIQLPAGILKILTDENDKPIDYIHLDINDAFEKYFNMPKESFLGEKVTKLFPGIENDENDWIDKFGQVAVLGTTYSYKAYSEMFNKWYSGMVYRPDPTKREVCVVFQDVSENVQSRQALLESEERYRNLFESMAQGVVYHDAEGNFIAANPAAERILGLTIDELMEKQLRGESCQAIHEDGSEFPGDIQPAMVALKTSRAVKNVTMGMIHPKDGEVYWIKVDAIPRFKGNDKSAPSQVYCTFTDITESKRFEQTILQAKHKAELADKLKSAFLANMSHEIRTPLNGIMGHIDLILANDLEESFRTDNLEGLRVARGSGELLLSIIQDILDLSKIEAGQMEVKNDDIFSVKAIVDQTSSLADTLISQKKKDIKFLADVNDEIHDTISGDRFRLQQVINNLISNAVKFTTHGTVNLCLRLQDDDDSDKKMIEIRVRDTGKGIPESHLESIFEPFRQVDFVDTRQHGGTGLGLTISRKLARMMGGDLRVESAASGPRKGSTLFFTLPYRPTKKRPSITPPNDQPSSIPRSEETNALRRGRKVLVAEDDAVSRKMVKRMLEITGYQVILAENGQEAVSTYEMNSDVGLILMDVQMPKMDGLDATKLIRQKESANSISCNVPIIALSAGAMKGDHERGLANGMTDYLTKPVNFKLLVRTLEKYIGCIENHHKP